MRDELIQPSFAIYNSPGVYALLLGSGVSQPANIPTGDEVMNDLIHKLVAMSGEESTESPTQWYQEKHGQEPTYDLLLEQLGTNKAERQKALKSYFVPTNEEIENNQKIPTKAHHSIAWLIKHNFIQVVVTTNFDRLLETALRELSIEPQVVTETNIETMIPVQHTDVTIIKIHGDYLETNLRNTADELSEYPEKMREQLKRIFTEYGLIVCGWSGKTDNALREMLTSNTSRYSTYFTSYTTPEGEVQELLKDRHAVTINNIGGDALFTEIQQMVDSLSGIDKDQKLSTAMIINRLKKLLATSNNYIAIEDMVKDELEEAIQKLDIQLVDPAFDEIWGNRSSKFQAYQESIKYYGNILERLVHICFVLSRHTDGKFSELFVYIIERTYEIKQPTSIWKVTPAIMLTYSIAISSILGKNWKNILAIVENPYVEFSWINRPKPKYINNLLRSFVTEFHNQFEGDSRLRFAGEEIFIVLQEYFNIHETSDNILIRTYDFCEVLLALLYLKHDSKPNSEMWTPWLPPCIYYIEPRSWNYLEEILGNIENSEFKSMIEILFPDNDEKHIYYLLKHQYDIRIDFQKSRQRNSQDGFPKLYEFVEKPGGGIF